jgi:peptidoglycan hydrolase-like protein with peptidoglycan-binding domain
VPVSTSPRLDAKQHLTLAFVARHRVGIFLIGRRGEEDMFVASKKLGAVIVFALTLSATLAASLPSCAAGPELSEEASAILRQDDVRNMQQALFDRGHYRGKVDGVMGLRTRESIRAFQKTENLPATGQIDSQTAQKLGIAQDCLAAKRTALDVAKGKPWAGTRVVKRIKEPDKTLPKIVATSIDH